MYILDVYIAKEVDALNRKYPEEFALACVQRYHDGRKVDVIAAEVGVARATIYNWIKKYKTVNKEENTQKFTLRKYRDLERSVERLKGIIEILKRIDCTVNAPLETKLRAMEELYGQYAVRMLCEAMDVPRGTFYNHILRNKKDNTSYAKRRDELKEQIFDVYNEFNQIFGSAKLAAVLQQRGIKVSVKMVRRLMAEMGLTSMRDGAKDMYDRDSRRYMNIIKQNFNVQEPNRVWVGDVTYFRYDETPYYISVVMDLFSRRVVGYKIGLRNTTQLIRASFKMAYDSRNPEPGLIFHTDQGSNYRSKAFGDYLSQRNVQQSFSRAHVPYDNSVVESFFAAMKREELYRTKFRSVRELKETIDKYMVFFNEVRPHATLNYKTPKHFEEEYWDRRIIAIEMEIDSTAPI